MYNKSICPEIINYISSSKGSSIGELYIRFHIMNKGKIYGGFKGDEITAKDIVACIEELYEKGIINYRLVNGEKMYYAV